MNSITGPAHPAVLRYSRGEIGATEAAELMGGDATVHDVIHQLREAGLPLARRMHEVDRAAVARAVALFGPRQRAGEATSEAHDGGD